MTVRLGGVGDDGGRECGGDGWGDGFLHWVGSPLAALLLRGEGVWVGWGCTALIALELASF